jgi:hypothetical protein
MATVLEEYTTEEQRSVIRFFAVKMESIHRILKKMVSVCGRKCLSHKAVHNWIKKFSQGRL